MKKVVLFLICVLFVGQSFAQMTSFMGKIYDEHNNVVPGATFKFYKSGKTTKLVADKDGVISTDQILAGDYYMDINANGRLIRMKKIFIQQEGALKLYYNFKLFSKGVVISLMHQNKPVAGQMNR
jgi:hypothetical protein